MNNNDKPNTDNTSSLENTSQENTSQPENTSPPSPQPEKESQPEKVSQTLTQPQLVDSPLIRGMDSANALAAKILFTRSKNEFVDHVFTDKDTGRKLSYAEMRMRYG